MNLKCNLAMAYVWYTHCTLKHNGWYHILNNGTKVTDLQALNMSGCTIAFRAGGWSYYDQVGQLFMGEEKKNEAREEISWDFCPTTTTCVLGMLTVID